MTYPTNQIPSVNPQNFAIATPVGLQSNPRDPTASDNTFVPGSEWQNTASGHFFKCVSATIAGAVWTPFIPRSRCASIPERMLTPIPCAALVHLGEHDAYLLDHQCTLGFIAQVQATGNDTILNVDLGTPLAQPVDGTMPRDHRQPRRQIASAGVEGVRISPQLEKHILQHILGPGRILQHPNDTA